MLWAAQGKETEGGTETRVQQSMKNLILPTPTRSSPSGAFCQPSQHLDFSLVRNIEPEELPKCFQIPNSQNHKVMFVVLIVEFWSNLNIAVDNLHCSQVVYEPIKHINI